MKSFSCGAVVPNCTASFTGESEGDILAQVAEHARVDHGMTDIPESVVAQVRSHIKDV
jgi:predicted small metal-binding protein